jgi:isoquinoline 1-oxidoreductase
MEGVIVVHDGDFVGVAAPTTYLANKAIAAIEKTATWDSPPHPDSKTLPQYLREHARGKSTPPDRQRHQFPT